MAQYSNLFTVMEQSGHVEDKAFEDHGVPPDVDMHGVIVRREASVESYQRCKNISHMTQ